MCDNSVRFDASYLESVKNYPYAGLDFLLDNEGRLVFIEANAVPGGIYVMSRANYLVLSLIHI